MGKNEYLYNVVHFSSCKQHSVHLGFLWFQSSMFFSIYILNIFHCSVMFDSATLRTAACQASLAFSLPGFFQTHVHWVSDAIQPSHPLSSTSPPALNISQHQGLFQWAESLHQMAKILGFQLQHRFFQWKFRIDFL